MTKLNTDAIGLLPVSFTQETIQAIVIFGAFLVALILIALI